AEVDHGRQGFVEGCAQRFVHRADPGSGEPALATREPSPDLAFLGPTLHGMEVPLQPQPEQEATGAEHRLLEVSEASLAPVPADHPWAARTPRRSRTRASPRSAQCAALPPAWWAPTRGHGSPANWSPAVRPTPCP